MSDNSSGVVKNPKRRVISDEAVEMGFHYLNDSSEEIALARANQIRAEFRAKKVFARMFKHSAGSVEMRKAIAMDSDEYAAAMEDVAIAEATWERMKDQRNRAELIIKAWQTFEASDRAPRNFR